MQLYLSALRQGRASVLWNSACCIHSQLGYVPIARRCFARWTARDRWGPCSSSGNAALGLGSAPVSTQECCETHRVTSHHRTGRLYGTDFQPPECGGWLVLGSARAVGIGELGRAGLCVGERCLWLDVV